jgi:iron-sulfur cluster repair protein YtfE (RIC family)
MRQRMKNYEEIKQGHREITAHLGRMHRILTERHLSSPDIVADLLRLKDELEQHFHYEEEGGLFRDIVEKSPHANERVNSLRKEHRVAIAQLTALSESAMLATGTPAWWEGLEYQFHEFSSQLMNHEHKEKELLQETYGLDLGAKD